MYGGDPLEETCSARVEVTGQLASSANFPPNCAALLCPALVLTCLKFLQGRLRYVTLEVRKQKAKQHPLGRYT